jgi:hypothetical protein
MALAAGSSGRARVGHALALLVHHKAAANRVVLAHGDFLALRVKGAKTQAVGVAGQAFAPQQQVVLVDPGDAVFAQQGRRWLLRIWATVGAIWSGSMRVRLVAGQAQQHSGVGAVPDARGESDPNSSATTWCTAASPMVACRWHENCRAAIMGPTVWELEGPMPILKRSKTLTDMVVRGRGSGCGSAKASGAVLPPHARNPCPSCRWRQGGPGWLACWVACQSSMMLLKM